MSPLTMYMTSSLGSTWNSLRPTRPRATNAIVSAVCHRMLTGFGEPLIVAITSAKLMELSGIMSSPPGPYSKRREARGLDRPCRSTLVPPMATILVMLPPQTSRTRAWASRLAEALPELSVVVAESETEAAKAVAEADAAFGTPSDAVLGQARRLRWLQAPQAAPPAGYYTPALIAHPVVVTNFREIYNDHIGAHIMAFVLAFARGFHHYFPRQLRREWRRQPSDSGVIHLPEANALIVGVGGIGAEAARLCAAFGMHVMGVDARRREAPP